MNSPQIKCIARFPINMLSQLENLEFGGIKNQSPKEMNFNQWESQNQKLFHYDLKQYQNLISPQQNVFDLNMIFNQNNQNAEPSLISTNDSNNKVEIDKLLNLDSNETWIDQSECMLELNHPINWPIEENQESVSLGNSKVKQEEMQLKEQKEEDLFESQQQEFYEEEPFDAQELENNEIKCEDEEVEVLPLFNKLTDQVIKKIEKYNEFDKKEMFPLKMDENEFLNDKFNAKIDYAFYKPHQNPNWNNFPQNINIMKMVRQSQYNQTKNIALLLGYYEKIKTIKQQKKQYKQEHLLSKNSYGIKKQI